METLKVKGKYEDILKGIEVNKYEDFVLTRNSDYAILVANTTKHEYWNDIDVLKLYIGNIKEEVIFNDITFTEPRYTFEIVNNGKILDKMELDPSHQRFFSGVKLLFESLFENKNNCYDEKSDCFDCDNIPF